MKATYETIMRSVCQSSGRRAIVRIAPVCLTTCVLGFGKGGQSWLAHLREEHIQALQGVGAAALGQPGERLGQQEEGGDSGEHAEDEADPPAELPAVRSEHGPDDERAEEARRC